MMHACQQEVTYIPNIISAFGGIMPLIISGVYLTMCKITVLVIKF